MLPLDSRIFEKHFARPLSKWDQIFKDAMTTAAAIDRLVHHSVILELNVSSYRVEKAKQTKSRGQDVST